MDISSELKNLQASLQSVKNYNYVLILHTKTRTDWRLNMVNVTCRSKEAVTTCLNLFATYPKIGIIGTSTWIRSLAQIILNHSLLNMMCSE